MSSTRYSPISSKLFAMSAAGTGASLLFMGSTAIENGSPRCSLAAKFYVVSLVESTDAEYPLWITCGPT